MNHGIAQNPLISVIIPLYQVHEYIEECLLSILSQVSAPNYELILIDDCGEDDTVDIALKLLSTVDNPPPYRLLHHEHNRGLSAARNSGAAVATGQYILFLDSDDCLFPHALQQLFTAAIDSRADVTIGAVKLASPTDCCSRYFQLPKTGTFDGQAFLEATISGTIYTPAWNKLVRRDFLTKHHLEFAEGLLHEDELWSMQLAFCRPSACLITEPTYLYRNIREGSIMKNITPAHLTSRAYILSVISELPQKYQIDPGPRFAQFLENRGNSWLWSGICTAYQQGVDMRSFSYTLASCATPDLRFWCRNSPHNRRLRQIGRRLSLWPIRLRQWLLYRYLRKTMKKVCPAVQHLGTMQSLLLWFMVMPTLLLCSLSGI